MSNLVDSMSGRHHVESGRRHAEPGRRHVESGRYPPCRMSGRWHVESGRCPSTSSRLQPILLPIATPTFLIRHLSSPRRILPNGVCTYLCIFELPTQSTAVDHPPSGKVSNAVAMSTRRLARFGLPSRRSGLEVLEVLGFLGAYAYSAQAIEVVARAVLITIRFHRVLRRRELVGFRTAKGEVNID